MLNFKPSSNIQLPHMPLGESRERKTNIMQSLMSGNCYVLLRICVCVYTFIFYAKLCIHTRVAMTNFMCFHKKHF